MTQMISASASPLPQIAPAVPARPSSSKPSLPSPRRASRAGSVKDVPGHFVKDVMRLNRFSKRGHHGRWRSSDLPYPQFSLPGFVHQNWAALSVGIVSETAPRPLFRFEHQFALDRIAVHVTQFFYALLLAEHHKVIEPALPDVTGLERSVPQLALSRVGL